MQAVSLRSYFIPAEPHHAEDSMHLPMDERLVTVQDVNINGVLLSRSAELAKVQILVKKKKRHSCDPLCFRLVTYFNIIWWYALTR